MLINAAVRQDYLNCSNEIVGLFKSDSIRGSFIGKITDVDITTRVLPWVNKMFVLSLPPVAFPHMRLICQLSVVAVLRWSLEVYGTIHCIACDEYFDSR